jgi:protein TonB
MPTPPKPVVKHVAVKPRPVKHEPVKHERPKHPQHHEHPVTPQPAPVTAPVTPPPPTPAPDPKPAPPTPTSAPTSQISASFESKVRSAVQTALHYPAAARMMQLTGRTKVGFTYTDGQIAGVHVVTSSGSDLLDRAAMAAVRDANYPSPETGQRHRPLDFAIWVQFAQDDSNS